MLESVATHLWHNFLLYSAFLSLSLVIAQPSNYFIYCYFHEAPLTIDCCGGPLLFVSYVALTSECRTVGSVWNERLKQRDCFVVDLSLVISPGSRKHVLLLYEAMTHSYHPL